MYMYIYQLWDLEIGFAQAGEATFGRLFAVLHTQVWKGSYSKEEN